MSKLAGLYRYDRRPISPESCQKAKRALGGAYEEGAGHSAPGLWMLQAPDPLEPAFSQTSFQGAASDACAFDGRIDNREELIVRLGGAPGPGFAPGAISNASLMLAIYQAMGLAGLDLVIGDWSVTIWNAARRILVLASDYAGVRPLYYRSLRDGTVVWASSLGALVAWTDASELDEQYIADFLTHGYSSRTPYRGIQAVPPGHAVCFAEGGEQKHQYWKPPLENVVRCARQEDYAEHLRELFREAVACRLKEGEAAAELSGGLDSSSVVSIASQIAGPGRPLVTFSYRAEGINDEKYFTLVERASNTTAVHLDSREYPFMTAKDTGDAAPCFWQPRWSGIARLMKSLGLRTLLTGQWGDFVMGNCVDDSEQAADYLRRGRWLAGFEEALAWSRALQTPVYSIFWRAVRASLPWRPPITGDLEATADAHRTYGDSLTAAFRKRSVFSEPALPGASGLSPTSRKRWSGLHALLRSRGLQSPEAMQPLACTHPFAHRPLVEYMLAVPSAVVCRPGQPRRLMRSAFAGWLPEPVLKRRSKSTYQGVFLQSLRPLAMQLLREDAPVLLVDRGYVDQSSLVSRLKLLVEGFECNEPQLRHLILLEFWLRRQERMLQSVEELAFARLA